MKAFFAAGLWVKVVTGSRKYTTQSRCLLFSILHAVSLNTEKKTVAGVARKQTKPSDKRDMPLSKIC